MHSRSPHPQLAALLVLMVYPTWPRPFIFRYLCTAHHVFLWLELLHLGKIEGKRRRGQQIMRRLNGITDSMDMSLCKLREIVKDREAWHAAIHEVTKSSTWLNGLTTITNSVYHQNYSRGDLPGCPVVRILPFNDGVQVLYLVGE